MGGGERPSGGWGGERPSGGWRVFKMTWLISVLDLC